MDRTAFDPKTGVVYVPNKEGTSWEELGPVDALPPETKYVPNKVAKDADGNSFMYNKFLKSWEEVPTGSDLVDYVPDVVPNSIKRGLRQAGLASDYAMYSAGLESEEDYAESIKETQLRNKQIQPPVKTQKALEKIFNPEQSYSDFAYNVVSNPDAIGTILGESAGTMAGAGLVSLGFTGPGRILKAAPWALRALSAAGYGLSSGVTEASGSIIDGLSDEGIDTFNEDAVKSALLDKDLMDRLQAKAALRGTAIGLFDAASAGLAGKSIGKAVSGRAGVLKSAAEETAVQAALGASGEASAQLVTEGSITDYPSVAIEALMEGITGVPQGIYQSVITGDAGFDMNNPLFRDMTTEAKTSADVAPDVLEEEVVGEAPKEPKAAPEPTPTTPAPETPAETKKKNRAVKQPYVSDVVDTKATGNLSAFTSLVEDIQPDDLKITEATVAKREQQKVQPVPVVDEASVIPTVLPKNLQGAKPKYKTAKLNFPSDVEKALYTVANRDVKSRKDDAYYTWLKDSVGLDDVQITKLGKEIKNDIKEQHNLTPDKTEFDAPKVEITPVQPKAKSASKAKKAPNVAPTESTTKLQRMLPNDSSLWTSPVFNLDQPYDLAYENLRGLKMSEANPVDVEGISKAVKQVTGSDINVEFFNDLREFHSDNKSTPVRGAQFLNTIAVSIDVNSGIQTDPFETAMHEAYHALKRYGTLTANDQDILSKQRKRIEAFVREQTGLLPEDIETMYSSEEGVEEVEAIAFGLWMSKQVGDSTKAYRPNQFTPMLNSIFSKLKAALKAIGSKFTGKKFDDVFKDIAQGRRAIDIQKEMNDKNTMIRWQKITQAAQANQQANNTKYAYQSVKELKDAVKRDNTELGPLGVYGRHVASMQHLASKSKVMQYVFNTYRAREMSANYVKAKADAILQETNFFNLKKSQINALHDLMDYNRLKEQKATLDEDGYLTYKKDGKIVRLKDKNLSEQYVTLQKSYAYIREETIRAIKHKISKNLDLPDNFTIKDVQQRLKDPKLDEVKRDVYTNILESLNEFESLKTKDYVPHKRFGDFGISVRNKETGELVYFKGIERGDLGNTHAKFYNKSQLEETLQELKEKYSDKNKYEILGANGKVKNLESIDSLEPFKLTYNNITNNLGDSFVSFDLLLSMLQSKDVDPTVLEDVKNSFYDQVINKGFAKHLIQSQNTDGYSKDWMRSQHTYLTGASNYIAGLAVNDRLNAIEKIVKEGSFKDKGLQKVVTDYVEYLKSSGEEYTKLRAFNFLWTMGFNASTAALQTLTLPTTTLSNITAFNSNPTSNMTAINKWFWVASTYASNTRNQDGTTLIDFSKREKVQELVDKGLLDTEGAELLKFMTEHGLTTPVQLEEYAGRRSYDTSTMAGRVKDKLTTFANLSGVMTSYAEQMTRFATVMASYEQIKKVPDIETKLMEVFKDDQKFLGMVDMYKDKLSITQIGAWHIMDNAHAVFGKLARSPLERGISGVFVFPFMRYPHNVLETLFRHYGQGKEGKRAFVYTLGSMFVLAGMIGLPGAELLKELYEEAHKRFFGEELDLDYEFRKAIYNQTGSEFLAETVTHGLTRSAMGLDISKRIGASVPGQEVLFALTGIRGDAGDLLGPSGGVLGQVSQAWEKYNTDASLGSILSSLSPTALSNVLKAATYADEGVYTTKNVKLIDEDELGAITPILVGLGFNTDQIATYRERNFFSKVVGTKYTAYMSTQRERGKKAMAKYFKAIENGDLKAASDYRDQYDKILREVIDKMKASKTPMDISSFNRSVMRGAVQRKDPEGTFKMNLPKAARSEKDIMDDVLGIGE